MIVLITLISASIQVAIFSAIPLIFYLVKNKKITGFLKYIGLIKPERKSIPISIVVALLYFGGSWLVYWKLGLLDTLRAEGLVGGAIQQMGLCVNAILIVLIKSMVATAMSEEILFRGFLGKRFINLIGFSYGNLLQSILFGLMHGVLFWGIIRNMVGITAIVLLTGTIGYLMGYINEKVGNGSIVPSWITHSLANIMTPLFFI